MLKLNRQQAGETIIEVLISLLVLSLIMGVAYSLASRSLKTSQEAQERTVASQMAQSTVEVIRTYAEQAETDANLAAKLFPAGPEEICVQVDLASVNASTPPTDYDPTNTAPCDHDIYRTKVEVVPILPSSPPEFEYVVRINWDSLVNTTENEVIMRYKWVRIVTP